MPGYTQPPVVDVWGQSATDPGDMVQPTNAQIDAGWPLSATPPARQYFNWLFNFLTNAVRYLAQRGLTDYNAAETYQLNARIIGDDGLTYVSIQNANTGNTPSTATSWWTRWGFTTSQVSALISALGLNFTSNAGLGFAANTAVTLSQLGRWGQFTAASVTVTMPLPASAPLGSTFTFADSSFAGTISATMNNGGSISTLAVPSGESVTLVNNGAAWYIASDGVSSAWALLGFGMSMALPGYIKFPNWLGGWIVEWGTGSPANTTISVAFPLSFPTTCLAVFGSTRTGTQTFSVDFSGGNWSITGNGTYWLLAIGH